MKEHVENIRKEIFKINKCFIFHFSNEYNFIIDKTDSIFDIILMENYGIKHSICSFEEN